MTKPSSSCQLSAFLGHPDQLHFPHPPPPHHVSTPPVKKKSPSQLRRQERRKCQAETKAASNNDILSEDSEKTHSSGESEDFAKKPADKPAEESFKCDQCDENFSCKANLRKHVMTKHKKPVTHERFKCDVCKENLDTRNFLTNHMISEHDHPGELLHCDLCEFVTSRKTGLDIHTSKKHKEIEQLDGNSSDSEVIYAESYWERDYMGPEYQTYLNAIENIDNSNFSREVQQSEIERAKITRLNYFLHDYGYTMDDLKRMRMPPWYHK